MEDKEREEEEEEADEKEDDGVPRKKANSPSTPGAQRGSPKKQPPKKPPRTCRSYEVAKQKLLAALASDVCKISEVAKQKLLAALQYKHWSKPGLQEGVEERSDRILVPLLSDYLKRSPYVQVDYEDFAFELALKIGLSYHDQERCCPCDETLKFAEDALKRAQSKQTLELFKDEKEKKIVLVWCTPPSTGTGVSNSKNQVAEVAKASTQNLFAEQEEEVEEEMEDKEQ